ncbi:hypothetical protein [Deinococcus hopiensis]|uniref:DRBM domain-containing protein n=1 Tax=Deinococcus hopiensis KR-140 TaxID=695939 RepID=A0A1W1VVU0_9DEIO|nr:hypothetical protein [Deinococcus hopiensis]SMB96984.1 hypothetical protein SAMN00790413_06265 [Deinococcus hopiensis KR-140]
MKREQQRRELWEALRQLQCEMTVLPLSKLRVNGRYVETIEIHRGGERIASGRGYSTKMALGMALKEAGEALKAQGFAMPEPF